MHIRHLREKVERDPKDPEYLFTGPRRRLPIPRHGSLGVLTPRLTTMTLSLRNRLALVFFAITLLAIAVLYLYVAPGLANRLLGEKLGQLSAAARSYSGPISRTVGSADPAPLVRATVQRAALMSGDRVTLLVVNQAQGGLQLSSQADSSNPATTQRLAFPVAVTAISSGKIYHRDRVHPFGQRGRGGVSDRRWTRT